MDGDRIRKPDYPERLLIFAFSFATLAFLPIVPMGQEASTESAVSFLLVLQ
jgi:hypothetical protein